MKLLITVLTLAVPAYVYTQLVWSVDRYEKEPPLYLLYAFIWGAIPTVLIAVVLQTLLSVPILLLLGESSLASELTQAAIGAPVIEEILKGIGVAIIYLTRRHEFDGWVDGIVYGATVGFGFAYVENIFYLMGTAGAGEWVALFVLRAIVFGGLHGFWTALTGIGFGLARYTRDRLVQVFVIAGGLLLAIVGHLIHNAAATLVEVTNGTSFGLALLNYGALAFVMGLLWLVAGIVDRRRLKQHLQEEVPAVIPIEIYQAICDRRYHVKLAQLGISRTQHKHLLQLAGELAQKKLQFTKMGDEGGNSAEIYRLRAALKELARR